MHKLFLNLFILIAVLVAAWAIVNMKFDLRRYASGEPGPIRTINATAIPIPTANNLFITTSGFPTAYTKSNYSTKISGYSLATNAVLSFNAIGLPSGLTVKNCKTNKESTKTTIECEISGIPTRSGFNQVTLNLVEARRGSIEKTLNLIVGSTLLK